MGQTMPSRDRGAYRPDLAWIHDDGFGDMARHAATLLLRTLRKAGVSQGQIVDLGCGSGVLAAAMSEAGYDVLGYDQSAAMIALARRRAPRVSFRQASFLRAKFPRCVAVTAIGEVFNYLFDRRNTPARLEELLTRIHRALQPGGVFLFDAALVGRVPGGKSRAHVQGGDWACLAESEEDPRRHILTRHITSFRKVGRSFRRDQEVHQLRLFDRRDLSEMLRQAGFRARLLTGYPPLRFPPGYAGFLATKTDPAR